jgi:hypothetical protein
VRDAAHRRLTAPRALGGKEERHGYLEDDVSEAGAAQGNTAGMHAGTGEEVPRRGQEALVCVGQAEAATSLGDTAAIQPPRVRGLRSDGGLLLGPLILLDLQTNAPSRPAFPTRRWPPPLGVGGGHPALRGQRSNVHGPASRKVLARSLRARPVGRAESAPAMRNPQSPRLRLDPPPPPQTSPLSVTI